MAEKQLGVEFNFDINNKEFIFANQLLLRSITFSNNVLEMLMFSTIFDFL